MSIDPHVMAGSARRGRRIIASALTVAVLAVTACTGDDTRPAQIDASEQKGTAPVSSSSPTSNPAEVQAALSEFAAFNDRFMDPNSRFSATEAYVELADWREVLEGHPEHAEDLRQLLYLTGSVVNRSATLPREVGIEAMDALMEMGPGERSLERRLFDHYIHARLLDALSQEDFETETYQKAAKQYALAADVMREHKPDDVEGLYNLTSRQGYLLHEAGRYEEALDVNRGVQSLLEEAYGKDADDLIPTLTNIAQNLHSLGRPDEIDPILERAQTLSIESGDDYSAQDMMFQRGVLAFERGEPDRAGEFMRARVDFVRKMDDPDLLEEAEGALQELDRRLSE